MVERREFLRAGVGAAVGVLAGMQMARGQAGGEGKAAAGAMGAGMRGIGARGEELMVHRFGVNYTPSKNWWYCWNDFDAGDIARDMDAIAGLGMDHLRVQLIWPYFQPNPGTVSGAHVKRLGELMRLAAERKLDVQVSVFTGGMSGFTFRPPFLVTQEDQARFYTSEGFWKAEQVLIVELAAMLKKQPNFLGFDIGNEINCTWRGKPREGDAWMDKVLGLMEKECPEQVHVNGVDHQPWMNGSTFSPQHLAERQRIVPLHCYAGFSGALQHGGVFDPASIKLMAGMAALVRAYGKDMKKPVWAQEFGMSREWVKEKRIPEFAEKAVTAGIEGGVSWFTWWCSHDIDRKFEFPSLEYDLGLLTVDQKVKDVGRKFKELAEAYRGKAVKIPARELAAAPTSWGRDEAWTWLMEWMK